MVDWIQAWQESPPYTMNPQIVRELLEPTFAFKPFYLQPILNPDPDWDVKAWLTRWRRT